MSCGVNIGGTFSPLDDAWSKASSLNMGNYEPYPELLPQNGCYGRLETYCGSGCSNNACGSYNTDVAAIQQRPGPSLTRSVSIAPVRQMRENFGSSQCCQFSKAPGAKYQALGSSWSVQQMYST